MKSKKILFIADGLGSGGAERQMVTVAGLLKKNGYDVYVLCYSRGDFYAHVLLDQAIPIIWKVEKRALPRMLKIRRYIRKGHFNAVISFLETPNFLNNFAAIGGHDWKVITGERSSKDSTFTSRKSKIFLWFHRYCDALVCNSENAKQRWAQRKPKYASKLHCIYNSVTLGLVHSTYEPRRGEKTNIIVAASHQYLKNGIGLIKALNEIDKEERKKIHVDWYGSKVVSGSGSAPYEEVLQFVRENNLESVIEFHDPTNDIADRMNQADAVALFSWLEGLPNTICEGMTLGKPIIMTRVSDYGILVNENNGFLCDWDNVESIKEALLSLSELPTETMLRMGKNSKNKAEGLFSQEAILINWIKLIEY